MSSQDQPQVAQVAVFGCVVFDRKDFSKTSLPSLQEKGNIDPSITVLGLRKVPLKSSSFGQFLLTSAVENPRGKPLDHCRLHRRSARQRTGAMACIRGHPRMPRRAGRTEKKTGRYLVDESAAPLSKLSKKTSRQTSLGKASTTPKLAGHACSAKGT